MDLSYINHFCLIIANFDLQSPHVNDISSSIKSHGNTEALQHGWQFLLSFFPFTYNPESFITALETHPQKTGQFSPYFVVMQPFYCQQSFYCQQTNFMIYLPKIISFKYIYKLLTLPLFNDQFSALLIFSLLSNQFCYLNFLTATH